MVRAHDAKAWANEELRGICDSLYTPFSGRDGDDVDYDAVRDLVRYTLGDLDHHVGDVSTCDLVNWPVAPSGDQLASNAQFDRPGRARAGKTLNELLRDRIKLTRALGD